MALEKHFDLIFRTAEGLNTLLPRTVAEQVMMIDGHTVADHINSDKHLLPTERFAMDRVNQAGGFIILDANGYVPLGFIDSTMIAVKTEFANIDDLLANGSNIRQGNIVFVNDCSADPNIGTNTWGIYRRNADPDPSVLTSWTCLTAGFTLDIDMEWDAIPGKPKSTVQSIDEMVSVSHEHPNSEVVNEISDADDAVTYKNKKVAFYSDVAQFYDEDMYNNNTRVGDFWLKESYSQSWWYDTTIENAGTSCYEMYRGYDTMETSPKIRTHNVTDMTRMFYGDTALKTLQQYKVNNVRNFTQMLANCTSLERVPITGTNSGEIFDQMFSGCTRLKYSPEMILTNATSVDKMYYGCTSLEYVLPFGSTSKVKNFREMFSACDSLKKIYSKIDFSSAVNTVGMFNGCIDLEEVEFVEGTLKTSLSLADTNLSAGSVVNILRGLPSVTNSAVLTLTGIPSLEDVPEAVINTARAKGWTIVTGTEPEPGPTTYDVTDTEELNTVLSNLSDGDSVVVSGDLNTSSGNSINITKEVTLQLNKDVVSDGAANSGLRVNTGGIVELSGEGVIVNNVPYDAAHSSGVVGIYGDGEVVFNGSGIDAVIDDDPVNKGQFGVCSFGNAKVTVNEGEFKAGWYCLSGNGSSTSADAVTTINGGIFESISDYAIYHPHKGTLIINGGDISGAAGALAANAGTIKINGGTLSVYGGGDTGEGGDGTSGLGNAAINLNARYADVTCEITGGTFIATGSDTILIATGSKHNVNLTITGGKFSSKPSAEWIPEGYACTDEPDTDGLYTVYKL